MNKKQKTCPVCAGKLGFLNHKFENEIKICNNCFTSADIKISELADRGQTNITIDEIRRRVIQSDNERSSCDLCGDKLTYLKTNKLADAQICTTCLVSAKMTFKEIKNLQSTGLSEVKNRINGDIENFNPSKEIGNYVQFNEDNKKMLIPPGEIVNYESIMSYELLEDGDTIASGGLGRAALGGALFGGAGAVVGAVTGNRKGNCRNLQIKVTVDNVGKSAAYITFIDKKTKKSSSSYKEAFKHAQECLSTLELILNHRKRSDETASKISSADEILKYKELLDIGAITEEEYELKKKELLGL